MSKYLEEWKQAIRRTKNFGLTVPPHEIDIDRTWLNVEAQKRFPFAVRDALGEIPAEQIGLQCISIHFRLQSVIEHWLGCPVLYTIGWVDDESPKGMYRFDDEFIRDRMENGHPSNQIRLHTWLTLPSMEIIDVSLATSIGLVQKIPEFLGRVFAQRADDLKGMTYKPMLVGPDFLFKTNMIKKFTIYEVD